MIKNTRENHKKFQKWFLKKIFRLGQTQPSLFGRGRTVNSGAALHCSRRTVENEDDEEEEGGGRGGGGSWLAVTTVVGGAAGGGKRRLLRRRRRRGGSWLAVTTVVGGAAGGGRRRLLLFSLLFCVASSFYLCPLCFFVSSFVSDGGGVVVDDWEERW